MCCKQTSSSDEVATLKTIFGRKVAVAAVFFLSFSALITEMAAHPYIVYLCIFRIGIFFLVAKTNKNSKII